MSQTTDQTDAVVSGLWPEVVAQQQDYYDAHGGYYQMLWTHTQPPSAATAADNMAARPTDQPASEIKGLPETMRSRMRIDTYGKPDGWTMTLQAVIDGQLWQRSVDCGSDQSRASAWHVVPPPPAR